MLTLQEPLMCFCQGSSSTLVEQYKLHLSRALVTVYDSPLFTPSFDFSSWPVIALTVCCIHLMCRDLTERFNIWINLLFHSSWCLLKYNYADTLLPGLLFCRCGVFIVNHCGRMALSEPSYSYISSSIGDRFTCLLQK